MSGRDRSLADEFYSAAPQFRTKARLAELIEQHVLDRIDSYHEPFAYVYEGFAGCSDVNPDICACATTTDPTCMYCDREVSDGDQVLSAWVVDDPFNRDRNDGHYQVVHEVCPPQEATT
ncbi:hypothetical protein GCM10009648_43990 [Tsukamurella spumae]